MRFSKVSMCPGVSAKVSVRFRCAQGWSRDSSRVSVRVREGFDVPRGGRETLVGFR